MTERTTIEALATGLLAAGVPLAMTGETRPRPRLALAAPLPKGATGDTELVEVYLSTRLPLETARSLVGSGLPPGFRLVALEDEWVGAPSLASRVTAIEYRVSVATAERISRDTLEVAARAADRGSGVSMTVAQWDEGAGRGELRLHIVCDQTGRCARPADVLDVFGPGIRIVVLRRMAIEIAD